MTAELVGAWMNAFNPLLTAAAVVVAGWVQSRFGAKGRV